MSGRLAAFWTYALDYLRNSLWFVPALLILGAVGLAYGALSVRMSIRGRDGAEVWWYHAGSARDAAALIETLLSSMISMTALIVSIMVVVLTLAAQQMGPRLIWNFSSDRRTQVSLGVFIGTITYLLLVLRSIDTQMPEHQVPHLAVTLASALSLTCIGVLLFFVHHLTHSIIADAVVRRVGANLDKTIARLPAAGPGDECRPPLPRDSASLTLSRGGYVQVVEYEQMARCAAAAGAVLFLDFRAGDHLLPRERRIHVAPASALTDALAEKIEAAVILGSERTAPQDIEFGLRQLVEIALRALSPGVNDPYTAMVVVHRLALALALIMDRPPLPRTIRDAKGVVRVHACPPTLADMAGAAFNQLRDAAEGKADVLTEILSALTGLRAHARTAEHRDALDGQTRAAVAAARRGIRDPDELAKLERLSSEPTRGGRS